MRTWLTRSRHRRMIRGVRTCARAPAARFSINAQTGALSFVSPPSFKTPTDVGVDNTYDVIVSVTDSAGARTSQAIAVRVGDNFERAQASNVDLVSASTTGAASNALSYMGHHSISGGFVTSQR